jgi:YHS domain-containing protein
MKCCSTLVFLMAAAVAAAQGPKKPVEALDGLDPVMLVQGKEVPGKSALSVVHGRFTYLFSTAETRATFEREPGKYEIQLGGICARMGKTAGGNPSDYLVHDGKIYIFGSDDCHKQFQLAPAKYLESAHATFPTSADAAARGRKLLDAVVRTTGDGAKLDSLTSYVETKSQVQKQPDGDVPVTTKTMWLFPDKVRQERSMAREGKVMSSSFVFAPDGMWFVSGTGQVYPTLEEARPSQEQELWRNPVVLLRSRNAAGFKAAAMGTATIDGTKVRQVRVVNGGLDVIVNVDGRNRIHSVSYNDRNNNGQYGAITLFYSDFRNVDGMSLPFAVRGLFDGQPDSTNSWTVESIELNSPLDPTLFAPAAKTDGAK